MRKPLLGTLGLYLAFALAAATSAQAETELELSGNDMMQFSATAFTVPAGEEITLVFNNVGKLPKQAMGHNVVILTPGSDVMAFGNAAMAHAQNDYIPTDDAAKEKIVANTKLLGPGESDTITFTLPEAGQYPFLCSFPGHFAIMKGVITAE